MKRWLSGLNISRRILVSAILPVVVVAFFLGYYMTEARMQDSWREFNRRGNTLVNYLASYSEFNVFAGNRKQLESDISTFLKQPDVVAVTIHDRQDNLLVHVTNAPSGESSGNDTTTFSTPIIASQVEITDYPRAESEYKPHGSVIGRVDLQLSNAAATDRQHQILANSTLLLLLGIVASLVLALVISRTVTSPLSGIVKTVRSLHTGELGSRVTIATGGELGQLADDINAMAGAIEDSQNRMSQEVEEATSGLQDLITILETKNRELEQARVEALQAGNAKSDFLARMSHEIRTPLSAVIGFSRLLDNTELSETQTEYIRTISQAASQLLVVIDDILGYTRLESATTSIEYIRFDLHDCLENAVSILSAAAREKQLELVLYIHSDVPHFFTGDQNRISQVVTNLVNNAIKFTEHGHIIIEVAVLDADEHSVTVNFMVTDTGPGIDAEHLGRIFEPFFQTDATVGRRFGGTGLGLSICRKLVELMGGEIRAESTPGEGSCFCFSLATTISSQPVTTPSPRFLAGRRVLIHDTDPFALRAIRNRFFTWGADVFYTPSRERLLDMLSAGAHGDQSYALLVIGLSATENSKSSIDDMLALVRRHTDMPLLLLVNGEIHSLFGSAGEIPATRLLSKPPRSDRIQRAVHKLLGLASVPPGGDTAAAGATETSLAGLEVLLAEDNRFNQQLLELMLSDLGVRTTLATDGNEACSLADRTRFDVILMDIHMPVMDGVSACQQLRKGINSNTPVIALTADVFAGQDDNLGALGINDCLYKPVAPLQLARMLAKWTGRSSMPQAQPGPADRRLPQYLRIQLREELQTCMQALRNNIRSGDTSGAREQLHLIKGMIDFFGVADFGNAFTRLQAAVHEQRHPDVERLLDTMEVLLTGWREDSV